MKIIFSILFFISLYLQPTHAQHAVTNLVATLNKQIVEIKSFTGEDSSEFAALDESIKGFKVIGLGEATHGTKEFYQYKAKLIKHLILNHRLKIVVFESDMVGMENFNDYVMDKGIKSIQQIFNGYGILGIYRTQEVAELMEWIKVHNSQQSASNKVMIAGMDANHPYGIATKLLQSTFLSVHLDNQLKKELTGIRAMPEQKNFGSSRKKHLLAVVEKLETIVKKQMTRDSASIYSHYIHLLRQSLNLINLGDIPLNTYRDLQMAENVKWLAASTKQGETIAVWGHNGHISSDKWRNYKTTGMHLRKYFKSQYYALALAVGEGYARLWDYRSNQPFHRSPLPPIERPDQVEFLFKQLTFPNFFLALDPVKLNKVSSEYFSKPLFSRALGAQTVKSESDILLPILIQKSYNGILFFRNTNNSSEIIHPVP